MAPLLQRIGSFARDVVKSVRNAGRDPLFWVTDRVRLAVGGMPRGSPYGYHPTVYRCVKVLADALATAPFRLSRVTAEGPRPVEAGPWLSLFRNPNPMMDEFELFQTTVTHMETEGACGWFLVGDDPAQLLLPDEIPQQIYPIRGGLFEVLKDPRTGRAAGWKVTDPETGKSAPFPFDQVVVFRFIDPENPWGWQSPLKAMAGDVRQDFKAGVWNERYFDNGAEPGGLLSTPNSLTEPEARRMHKDWWDTHGGPDRQHRIAILSNGATYHSTSNTHKEMAFGDQKKANRRTIAGVYGVPVWFLGESDDLSYATAKSAERILYTATVIPLAGLISRRVDAKLLQVRDPLARKVGRDMPGSLYCNFDFGAIEALRDDLVNRLTAAGLYRGLGVPVATINEIMELGIPEEVLRGWGEVPLLPFGLAPASEIVLAPDPAEVVAGGEPILGEGGEAPLLGDGGAEDAPILSDGDEEPLLADEPGGAQPILAGGGRPILKGLLAVGVEARRARTEAEAVEVVARLGVDVVGATVCRTRSGFAVAVDEASRFDRRTLVRVRVGDGVVAIEGELLDSDDGTWAHGCEAHDTPADDGRSAAFATSPGRARRLRVWRGLVRTVLDPNERRFRALARRHVARVYRDVLAGLPQRSARDVADDVESVIARNRDAWDAALRALSRGVYARISSDAIAALDGEIEGGLEVVHATDPDILDFLRRKEVRLANEVDSTLAEEVRDVVLRGRAEGKTVLEIRDDLAAQQGVSLGRAKTIARTEVSQAANGVRHVALQREGVTGREWIAAGDAVVRATHQWLDGKIASGRDPYPVPPLPEWRGEALDYPSDMDGHPSQVVNCRCAEGAVID